MNDLISRQMAIDALNDYFARIEKLKRRGLTTGEKAISLDTVGTIETLPSTQPERKWIPCRERLPEDDTEVLVYLFENNKSPYIAWVCDGCWFTEEFQVEKENYPKAWMPLPEPYRKDGD